MGDCGVSSLAWKDGRGFSKERSSVDVVQYCFWDMKWLNQVASVDCANYLSPSREDCGEERESERVKDTRQKQGSMSLGVCGATALWGREVGTHKAR